MKRLLPVLLMALLVGACGSATPSESPSTSPSDSPVAVTCTPSYSLVSAIPVVQARVAWAFTGPKKLPKKAEFSGDYATFDSLIEGSDFGGSTQEAVDALFATPNVTTPALEALLIEAETALGTTDLLGGTVSLARPDSSIQTGPVFLGAREYSIRGEAVTKLTVRVDGCATATQSVVTPGTKVSGMVTLTARLLPGDALLSSFVRYVVGSCDGNPATLSTKVTDWAAALSARLGADNQITQEVFNQIHLRICAE